VHSKIVISIFCAAKSVHDTGADGGILVNPLGLQEGAERVAAAENIISVRLNEDCNRYEFVLGFLNKIMLGVLDQISISEEVQVKLVPETEA
jgi:hypothetical protein